MKPSWLAVAVLLASFTNMAFPQGGRLGESCDLASQGVHETKTFLAFDQELRQALSKQDAGMMALLVKFPLRVNDERGSYYLNDPFSLQGRFQEVFPPKVRGMVLNQPPNTILCNYAGIMYGDGVVWVTRTDQGYAIETVNLPEAGNSSKTMGYRVKFVCQTDKYRIIVDEPDGALRYRSWNKPRSLLEEPDTEITKGKEDSEGTGPCAYRVWTFTSQATKVVVERLGGCSDDERPKGAVGSLELTTKGEPAVTSWCF